MKPLTIRVVLEHRWAIVPGFDALTRDSYLHAAMIESIKRGEAPYASAVMFAMSGVLDDDKPAERTAGMEAGFLWGACAEKCVVLVDFGISKGMREGIKRAMVAGQKIELRSLPGFYSSRARYWLDLDELAMRRREIRPIAELLLDVCYGERTPICGAEASHVEMTRVIDDVTCPSCKLQLPDGGL